MKKCSRCDILKSEEEFSKKKDTKDKLKSCCKVCDNIYYQKFYTKNKEKLKQLSRENSQIKGELNKENKKAYLMTHPCVDCGNSDVRVLEFHHHNDDKSFTIARKIRSQCRWETILLEINKCIVLCANCHRIRHSR